MNMRSFCIISLPLVKQSKQAMKMIIGLEYKYVWSLNICSEIYFDYTPVALHNEIVFDRNDTFSIL